MPILNWLTRDEDIKAASRAPYRLLEVVPKLSTGNKNDNMLIQGDNLEALKALLPYYAGRVKCIYIDPPYNTKSAFEHYDDSLEHSKWLSMMYPRLEMLWHFLSSKNGVILISINDDEGHYLKTICDEIFGRKKFIATLIWNYEGNTDNQAKIINYHEYILVYSKSGEIDYPDVIDPNIGNKSKLFNQEIRNTVIKNGPKNPIKPVNLKPGFPANFKEGIIEPNEVEFPKYSQSLIIKNYKLQNSVIAESGWASKKILAQFITNSFLPVLDTKNQETTFELTKTGAIEGVKKRVGQKGHFISVLRGLGTTNQMRILLEKLGLKFTFPKPVGLISYLIQAFSRDGDIVLDSFAGSGSTGHSILSSNRKTQSNRRFILIEMDKNNAENIIAARLTKVISGAPEADLEACGGGFRFYRLGETVFDEEGQINQKVHFPALASHIWFSETGKPYEENAKTPYLGIHDGVAYALLYNGILGDKRVNGGNVLTRTVLKQLHKRAKGFKGSWVIYGEMCRISSESLSDEKITFKQTPYDVRAR